MGTYYKGAPGRECEQANRLEPEGIRAVHRAYLEGARRLQAAGTDLMTVADCPIARARMDSSLVACRVHRELGLPTPVSYTHLLHCSP